MKAGLIIEIIYYVIALIIFILFRRKKIIVTFNGKEQIFCQAKEKK